MIVSKKELTDLLGRVWDSAQDSPFELREQIVDELLLEFHSNQQQPLSILTFEAWMGLPSGKKIFHSLFGEGLVLVRAGERYVSFRGFRMELAEAGWPWDQAVRLL